MYILKEPGKIEENEEKFKGQCVNLYFVTYCNVTLPNAMLGTSGVEAKIQNNKTSSGILLHLLQNIEHT